MNFLNLEQLPFVGMSYEFHGEKQGAPFSAYIVEAKPGQGPPLHMHPYVEVGFTLEGTGTMTVGDDTREVNAGCIVVIPANTPHRFVNSGDCVLRQIGNEDPWADPANTRSRAGMLRLVRCTDLCSSKSLAV
jgi:mannose-6-phosphate isomerase-like protein (cupin superfamily)